MQSKDNPLCNTQGYYAQQSTATRGVIAGAMHDDSANLVQRKNGGGLNFPSQGVKRGPPVDPQAIPQLA